MTLQRFLLPAIAAWLVLRLFEDCNGSALTYAAKSSNPPGIASILAGRYNVTTYVPPPIHVALNRKLLMTGGCSRSSSPTANSSSSSSSSACLEEPGRIDHASISRMSASPLAQSCFMVDPVSLQPVADFANRAAMNQMSEDPAFFQIMR